MQYPGAVAALAGEDGGAEPALGQQKLRKKKFPQCVRVRQNLRRKNFEKLFPTMFGAIMLLLLLLLRILHYQV